MNVEKMIVGALSMFMALILAIAENTIATQSAGNFTGYAAMLYPIIYIVIVAVPLAVGIGLVIQALREN